MNTPIVLEELTRQALEGDRDALDRLVRALQGDIYGLALRMLWNREDAEDATQEILVRIVTRLSQFRFETRLKTWACRLAVNYILDVKKSPIEQFNLSFDRLPRIWRRAANRRARPIRITDSYFGKNGALAGLGTGASLGYVEIEPTFMDMVGTKVTNQPVAIEMDQAKRNYLHPVAGSDAAKIGAGLFAKALG